MAEIKTSLDIDLKIRVKFELTESEARALDAMVGYGFEPFKEVFYSKLGKAYMEKHENGLKTLFNSIKKQVVPNLTKIDTFKRELSTSLVKTENKITIS